MRASYEGKLTAPITATPIPRSSILLNKGAQSGTEMEGQRLAHFGGVVVAHERSKECVLGLVDDVCVAAHFEERRTEALNLVEASLALKQLPHVVNAKCNCRPLPFPLRFKSTRVHLEKRIEVTSSGKFVDIPGFRDDDESRVSPSSQQKPEQIQLNLFDLLVCETFRSTLSRMYSNRSSPTFGRL
jgi:hypothetical protein